MRNTLTFISLIFLTGCVDPFTTDTSKTSNRIVVEGAITDQPPPYNITLTQTANFSQEIDGIVRYVSGATVNVCDEDGICTPFFEVEKGRYQTAVGATQGQIGKTYHVEITTADGIQIASSPEKMNTPPPVSEIYFEYDPTTVVQDGFKVYIDVQDPANERNYYKWETYAYTKYSEFCFNKVPERSVFLIESDKIVNGNKLSRVMVRAVPFNSTDYAVVEVFQLGISEKAFELLDGIRKQAATSGSIFDPPPSFLRGNLYNVNDASDDVLGYFIVAGVSKKSLVIDRTVTGLVPNPFIGLVGEPVYCGDPCNLLCVSYGGGQCGVRPCPPDCAYLPNKTNIAPEAWPLNHHPCE